jgi:Fe-S oxidoreductase
MEIHLIPTQNYFGPIPGFVIFWAIFLLALTVFLHKAIKLIRYLNLGRNINRTNRLSSRIIAAINQTVLQRCTLRNCLNMDFSGISHAIIFWGFGVFLLNYILFIFIKGGLGLVDWVDGLIITPWLKMVTDWVGVLIVAMVIWAAFRRYIMKPKRLTGSREAGIILLWIFLLMVVYFMQEGIPVINQVFKHYLLTLFPQTVPNLLESLELNFDTKQSLNQILWWLHYCLIMGFFVYLPYSKHLHILTAPFNLVFAPDRRVGTFTTDGAVSDLIEQDIGFLHWKHIFDLFCCTECGRCQVSCPATNAGTPLKPKDMVLKLKSFILKNGDELMSALKHPKANNFSPNPEDKMVGSLIGEPELWACTTCGRCQQECPVLIEHVDRIVSLRRCLIESGKSTGSLSNLLESLSLLGNPWTRSPEERTNWVVDGNIYFAQENKHVNILYWVGCTGAYDPQGQDIAQTMVEILKTAGISFAILGAGEKCCGEPARRTGEEGLFQKLACDNILTLNKYKFDRIMTHCPHCYNIIRHEYAEFGGQFEVIHHTELLSESISKGNIIFKNFRKRITYHDPCYIGRYNGLYYPARSLIQAIPGVELVEMTNNKNRAICCGGGGGLFWLEWPTGERINYHRFAQVEEVSPQTLITACPFCKILLDDACRFRGLENKIKVEDIVEFIKSCLLT